MGEFHYHCKKEAEKYLEIINKVYRRFGYVHNRASEIV